MPFEPSFPSPNPLPSPNLGNAAQVRETPALEILHGELSIAQEHLACILLRLQRTVDRAFGEPPETQQPLTGRSQRFSGGIGEIEARINALADLLIGLDNVTPRIESIA